MTIEEKYRYIADCKEYARQSNLKYKDGERFIKYYCFDKFLTYLNYSNLLKKSSKNEDK
jgi:predicted patatin/cPLA2 family phospholipase